eukprot:Lithocolla_globosa_v1_NODE_6055_length_1143_cov_12.242647.p1 type:complete len:335 gc:universal NODE_6055_length_1143_cov_12.242647:1072-68(-)
MGSWQEILLWVTLGIGVVGTLMTILGTILHLRLYQQPELQRYIVRITLMVPVYIWTCWFSMAFPQTSLSLDLVRDCYEAFILVCFFTLIVNKLEGEAKTIQVLGRQTLRMRYFICCKKMKFQEKADEVFLTLKRGILQFSLVMPVITLAILVLSLLNLLFNDYSFTGINLYLQLVHVVSVLISLVFLLQFYKLTRSSLPVKFNAFGKFLCLKAVIFLAFLQTLGINMAVSIAQSELPEEERFEVDYLLNGLLVIEMCILSFFHLSVFGAKEFRVLESGVRVTWTQALWDVINLSDFRTDSFNTFCLRKSTHQIMEEEESAMGDDMEYTIMNDRD